MRISEIVRDKLERVDELLVRMGGFGTSRAFGDDGAAIDGRTLKLTISLSEQLFER